MTIYAAGWDSASMPVENGTISETTSSTWKYSGTRRAALVNQDINTRAVNLTSGQSELWIHYYWYMRFGCVAAEIPLIIMTGSNENYRLYIQTGGEPTPDCRLQKTTNGSTWTDLITGIALPDDILTQIDIYLDIHASTGAAAVYVNRRLAGSVSSTDTSSQDSTVDKLHFQGGHSFYDHGISGVFVADETTINMRPEELYPSAAGTNTNWTGAYTAIDDNTYSTADAITSNTNGHKSTFGMTDLAALTAQEEVKAVAMATTGYLEGGSTPTDIDHIARHASTDYTVGSYGLPADGSENDLVTIMNLDPASGAWSESDVNALELGVEAAA